MSDKSSSSFYIASLVLSLSLSVVIMMMMMVIMMINQLLINYLIYLIYDESALCVPIGEVKINYNKSTSRDVMILIKNTYEPIIQVYRM